MGRTKPFLIGLMFGAGLSFVALRYHVVRDSEGFMLVPRTDQPPVRSAYADVREWGSAMWKQYPEVAAALVKDGHGKLVAESMTGDLLGKIEPDDSEALDLLPENVPPAPVRPASTVRKNPPTPIRLSPTGVDRPIAPGRPARLSQPQFDENRSVSSDRPTTGTPDAASGRVRSALESLFAPYDSTAGGPTMKTPGAGSTANTRSSIPSSSAAPSGRVLDLQNLNIDLGPAKQVIPSSSIPQQAASAGLFSPRRIFDEPAKVATSQSSATSESAVSTGPTHQFPLK